MINPVDPALNDLLLWVCKLGVAGFTALGSAAVAIKYYFRRVAKMEAGKAAIQARLQREAGEYQSKLLARFENDIARHEKKLDENTAAQVRLSEDMAQVKVQVHQLLENQPKFLEMMGKFIHSLRKQGMKTATEEIKGSKGLIRVSEEEEKS